MLQCLTLYFDVCWTRPSWLGQEIEGKFAAVAIHFIQYPKRHISGILSSQDIPNRLGHLLRCSKLCWFFNSMTSLLRGAELYKIWKPWSEQRKAGKITDSNKQQIAAVYAVCTLLCWAFVAKVFFWPQPFPLSDPAANWYMDHFQNSGYKTKIKKTVHVLSRLI